MGLYFAFSSGLSFLKIGVMAATFNSDWNFSFTIALLIQLVKGMHISFASEHKAIVGIMLLVDSFWFTLRMAL